MKTKNLCMFLNFCENPRLCCSFCSIENCEDRCMDNPEKCKWLTDSIKEPSGKFEKTDPKPPKKKKKEQFEIPQKIPKNNKKRKK